MFFRKKEPAPLLFDRENARPVLRVSICTGEQVAGFKNIHTGQFTDICLIRNSGDLEDFCRRCGISPNEITKDY